MALYMTDSHQEAFLRPAIREIAPYLEQYLQQINIHMYPGEEGFSVKLEQGEATLLAAGRVEALRALCALASAIQNGKTSFYLEQQTPFDTRGVMYDCSRNSVPKVATVKLLLRRMALMGLNALMLYTEDTYEVAQTPALGHYRGRYSQAEMKEIDDYANLLGIEVIPCIQTVAHLERLLRWSCTADVRDDPTTLYVGKDETYQLIRNMIISASAPVRSRRIHLGLDEAHGLGLGRKLDEEGYHDKLSLMKEHLGRVQSICQELGVAPMMWGDMLFRMNILGNGYYDDNVCLPETMADVIPKGIQVFYWDYYHNNQDFYDLYIREHQKLGIQPLFAGGVCSWLGMQPNLLKSKASIRAGLNACREAGVREAFTTVWRDDGGEGMPGSVIPGIQMFAEECWEARQGRCDSLLDSQALVASGMTAKQRTALGSFDELHEGLSLQGLEPPNPHKYLLWQDPLLGQFDCEAATGDYGAYYRQKAQELEDTDGCAAEAADALRLARALADFLSFKADLGVRLKTAYDLHDRVGLSAIALQMESEILPSLRRLYMLHRSLWMKWYKPFGWEVQDIRYGGLTSRMETALIRLRSHLEGDLLALEELDHPRLTYAGLQPTGEETLPSYNAYHCIATVSIL